jgi:uncharacterized protein (TIGR03083 family)
MEYAEHLAAIGSNVEAMVAALRDRHELEVPSCPGWNGADLLAHVANVMAQKLPVFSARRTEAPERGSWVRTSAADPDLGPRVVELTAQVGRELAEMGPGVALWSWYQRDQSSDFWARRLAHEALIHRVDAELAAGLDSCCPEELAADGLGELLEVFLARPGRPLKDGGPEAVIHLHGEDRECDWSVTLGGEEVIVQPGHHGPPAALLSGEAANLYLWGWGRGAQDKVSIAGDPALAPRLRALLASAT